MSSPELSRVPGQGSPEPVHINPLPEGINVGEIVIPEAAADARIVEMAREIAAAYKDEDLVLVGVITGADDTLVKLSNALFRAGHRTHEKTYIELKSYEENQKTSLEVVRGPERKKVQNRKAVIVEDVRQTDASLALSIELVIDADADEVESLILVDKPDDRLTTTTNPRWIGFVVHNDKDGDVWLEGRGMDSHQGGRGNPDIIKGPMHFTEKQKARDQKAA